MKPTSKGQPRSETKQSASSKSLLLIGLGGCVAVVLVFGTAAAVGIGYLLTRTKSEKPDGDFAQSREDRRKESSPAVKPTVKDQIKPTQKPDPSPAQTQSPIPATDPPSRTQPNAPAPIERKKQVDAKGIFKDFKQNEIAGNKKYTGNLVQIQGCVLELGKKDGKVFAVLSVQEFFGVVYQGFYCVFDDDGGLDEIVVKQSVASIKGEVADYSKRKTPPATSSLDAHPEYQEFVKLIHCQVVNIEQSRSAIKEAEAKKAQAEQEAKKQRQQAEKDAATRREQEAQRQVELAQKERVEARARSILRAGLQLAGRGFEKEARKRYQEVIDKYPDTEAAAKAKKLLEKP